MTSLKGGGYFVIVSDTSGSTTSRVAQLTIVPAFIRFTAGPIYTDVEPSQSGTWCDYDLDGRPDLFFTTGAARLFTYADIVITPSMLVGRTQWEAFKASAEGREQNFAFRNLDGLHFEDVSCAWGLDRNRQETRRAREE